MPREITIKPVLNGFICKVGCQTVVFNDVHTLAVSVEEYFRNPEEVEKRFLETAINKLEELPPPPPDRFVAQDAGTLAVAQTERPLEGRIRR